LSGARVLDLYAGTGALGIEALSRGAAALTSVESNRRAAGVLSRNLADCQAEERAELRTADVQRTLARLIKEGAQFDGVFIDPPYATGLATATLASIGGSGMIVDGGWGIVETARDEELPQSASVVKRVREDLYGDTKVTLYECNQPGD
jgi:16S rRNA (guanine966-N2)-methyltransferase